jgi:hypothetical protein
MVTRAAAKEIVKASLSVAKPRLSIVPSLCPVRSPGEQKAFGLNHAT